MSNFMPTHNNGFQVQKHTFLFCQPPFPCTIAEPETILKHYEPLDKKKQAVKQVKEQEAGKL